MATVHHGQRDSLAETTGPLLLFHELLVLGGSLRGSMMILKHLDRVAKVL